MPKRGFKASAAHRQKNAASNRAAWVTDAGRKRRDALVERNVKRAAKRQAEREKAEQEKRAAELAADADRRAALPGSETGAWHLAYRRKPESPEQSAADMVAFLRRFGRRI